MRTLTVFILVFLFTLPATAQPKKDEPAAQSATAQAVTLVIVCQANMKNTTNVWLRNNLGATGDNLTVELIGVNDPDDTPATHYACNWNVFAEPHAQLFQTGVVNNSSNVWMFTQVDFWSAIASLGLRVKPPVMPG